MKKINFGVVFIAILVIVLFVITTIESTQKIKEKENVTNIIKEYLSLHTKYFMLDEEYRSIDKVIGNDEYNKYLTKIKNEVSKYVLYDRIDYTFNKYKSVLDTQLDGKYIIKNCSKEFLDIKEFSFDGNYIFVLFDEIIKIDKDNRLLGVKSDKTGRYEGQIKSTIYSFISQEYIVLEKIDNEYKVVYDMTMFVNPETMPSDPMDILNQML